MEEWNSARLLCIYGDEYTILSREDQCSALPILSGRNHFCLEAMNDNLKQAFKNLRWSLFFFLFFPFFLSFFFFKILFLKTVWKIDFYIYLLACCVHRHRRQDIKSASFFDLDTPVMLRPALLTFLEQLRHFKACLTVLDISQWQGGTGSSGKYSVSTRLNQLKMVLQKFAKMTFCLHI